MPRMVRGKSDSETGGPWDTRLHGPPFFRASVPEPAKPVDLSRHLGRWYEIARYDSSFERDCEGVAAEYSLRQPPPVCAMLRLPALP